MHSTKELCGTPSPLLGGVAMPPAVAAIPRAVSVHEVAADRLLSSPALDERSWALFRSGPGGNAPLGEELAVAVVQRSFALESEEHVLAWCCFLLDAAADASGPGPLAPGGTPGHAGDALQPGDLAPGWPGGYATGGGDQGGFLADRASWALTLCRALLTRLVHASDRSLGPGRVVGAVQAGVHNKLAGLLRSLTRVVAEPQLLAGPAASPVQRDKRLAGAMRAIHAVLMLHRHIQGPSGHGRVPDWEAGPLVARLWALVPHWGACTPGGPGGGDTAAVLVSAESPVVCQPTVTRTVQGLILYHPEAAAALCHCPQSLDKLSGWVSAAQGPGAGEQLPQLRSEVVDLLCSLFKAAPPDCLTALQDAHLGAAAACVAADTGCGLITRVAALVAVGALRERPAFDPGTWWPTVDAPLRCCAAALLDALQEPDQRAEILSHFHSSPGGRNARAAALVAAVASPDSAATLCAATRLCMATAPERLAAAARVERQLLLCVPGLRPSLLALATSLEDPLMARLGAVLLTQLAACEALEGECALLSSLAASGRAMTSLGATVELHLLPEDPDCDGDPGWPVVLPANRELLAATCPFFRAMFTGSGGAHAEATAKVVSLRGVDPAACGAVLNYLATGALRVPHQMEGALAILGVAERFMVEDLHTDMTAQVMAIVTPENIGALLRFADAAGREELCDWTCKWAVSGGHATALVRSGCLAGLPGGAAHVLMMAIATRADSMASGPAVPEPAGGGVKRKLDDR